MPRPISAVVLSVIGIVGITGALALPHGSAGAVGAARAKAIRPVAAHVEMRAAHRAQHPATPTPSTRHAAPLTPPTRPVPPTGCMLRGLAAPGHTGASACVIPIPLFAGTPCMSLLLDQAQPSAPSCARVMPPTCSPPSGAIPIGQAQPCAAVPRGAILINRTPGR